MPTLPNDISTSVQHTVRETVRVSGVGLFTGGEVSATIAPAGPGEGIRFRRVDLPGDEPIPATVTHVVPAPRRTVLQRGAARVETVEHCLAAFAGLGVDNAVVEVDGPELPAGDGSALPFVEALTAAGLRPQDEEREPLVITEPVVVSEGDATLAAVPGDPESLELVFTLDYGEGSVLGRQSELLSLPGGPFLDAIAPARTFSTAEEARAARDAGLFGHLSPADMLVIGEQGPIDNAYRFENEPARHKLLDLLGDVSLVGRPVRGRLIAFRSGHALNHRLARALLRTGPARGDRAEMLDAPAMDIRQILELLPHRYPMVLVDRVVQLEPGRRALGIKNVSINEPFFQGHYPGTPIMPGVLIVEAMCQLAGLMLGRGLEREGRIAVLLSMDGVKLRRPVTPGDQLLMETETVRTGARFGDVRCRASVAGAHAAEARVKFMMVRPEDAA